MWILVAVCLLYFLFHSVGRRCQVENVDLLVKNTKLYNSYLKCSRPLMCIYGWGRSYFVIRSGR